MRFLQILLLRLVVVVVVVELVVNAAATIAKPGCPQNCGKLTIRYPFGTSLNCSRNENFLIACNDSKPYFLANGYFNNRTNLTVLDISLDGELRVSTWLGAYACYNKSGELVDYYNSLFSTNFSISSTKNKVTVVGCDTYAYVEQYQGSGYISGCMSMCDNFDSVVAGSCSGIGCCQTSIGEGVLNELQLTVSSYKNHTDVIFFNPCGVAFLAEEGSHTFFPDELLKNMTVSGFAPMPVVLDWSIGDWDWETCETATKLSSYACGQNSICYNSPNGFGYLCNCSQGYQGNPYLSNGCQDIDECKGREKRVCPIGALCKNTEGSYSCVCPPGSHSIHGNGTACIPDQGRRSLQLIISLGIGIAICVLLLIAIGLWLYHKLEKRRKNKIKQKFFKRNGGLLLQQQISSSTESVVKTKLFISEELEKATDKFNESRILGKGGLGTVYKGMSSDGSIVAVKKSNIVNENQVGQFINEVLILSHINHRNIVKLLGCCLETEIPILVYEYVSNGTLSDHLHDEGYVSMTWNNRLRVAGEIAGALAYLHSCASTAIIHRDIKSSNILLDNNYRAVVSDFGISRSIPLNKTHWTTIVGGTFGYFDPEYFRSGQLTDRSDVYAFGVVLAELLTGKKAISSDGSYEEGLALHFRSSLKQNSLFEVLDTQVVNESQDEEIHVVATLAKRCLKLNAKKRPSMKEVAAELDQLTRIQELPLIQQNSLYNYHLVSERSSSYTIDAVEEES